MARQEQVVTEELAPPRAEQLESSRKRRRLNATANDMEENLAFTSATMDQVTNGLDRASNYEVPSLDKISIQQTDVCRCSLAISEFSIRSSVRALPKIHTTVQGFSRMRHHLIVARIDPLAKSISGDAFSFMILENTWRKTRILRSSYYDVAHAPAEPQSS